MVEMTQHQMYNYYQYAVSSDEVFARQTLSGHHYRLESEQGNPDGLYLRQTDKGRINVLFVLFSYFYIIYIFTFFHFSIITK